MDQYIGKMLDNLLSISKSRGASDNVTAVLMLMRKQ